MKQTAGMRISIFGLGYVGAVSMACLARMATKWSASTSIRRSSTIGSGRSPIGGGNGGIDRRSRSGRASVTASSDVAVAGSDVPVVHMRRYAVSPNGAHDLTALRHVCEQIGAVLKKGGHHTVVIRSTVAPGTTEDSGRPVSWSARREGRGDNCRSGFQPEFLREGVSIKDFNNPPMTIVGGVGAGVHAVRRLSKELPCDFMDRRRSAPQKW